ncbi:MAG TPA: twin-arginine translocase subunit TatC, partial [Actinomycetes bacterium]
MRLSRRPRVNPAGEMSILEHIGELRGRLVKSCAALVVATVVAFFFLYEPVLDFVLRSYCALPASVRIGTTGAEGGCRLAALSPLEPLSIRVRLSLTVGLLLAMPFIAYQLWRFITPGLKPSEKRFAIPFALASTCLFVFGVAVAFLTLPKAIDF